MLPKGIFSCSIHNLVCNFLRKLLNSNVNGRYIFFQKCRFNFVFKSNVLFKGFTSEFQGYSFDIDENLPAWGRKKSCQNLEKFGHNLIIFIWGTYSEIKQWASMDIFDEIHMSRFQTNPYTNPIVPYIIICEFFKCWYYMKT